MNDEEFRGRIPTPACGLARNDGVSAPAGAGTGERIATPVTRSLVRNDNSGAVRNDRNIGGGFAMTGTSWGSEWQLWWKRGAE